MNKKIPAQVSLSSIIILLCFLHAVLLVSCNTRTGNQTNKEKQPAVDSVGLLKGEALYGNYCGGCHGQQLQGSVAPALVNTTLKHGGGFDSIHTTISKGILSTEMIGYADVLSKDQIGDIAHYIVEVRKSPELITRHNRPSEVKTKHYTLKVERMVNEGLEKPWGFDFLNRDSILVTFNKGELRWIVRGKTDPKIIEGTPKTYASDAVGGLMDVAIDPAYSKNGWVYLAYSYNKTGSADKKTPGTTKIVRGKIKEHQWVDEEVLFQAPDSLFITDGTRWGCRFLFDRQGYLYFTIGDMQGAKQSGRNPQLLTRTEGKIYRVNSDGTIPKDNPLHGKKNVLQAIYAWGTRNVQGIAQHPVTGELYFSDHGPRGGDELNKLKNGGNYGWPDITYGINYDSTSITRQTHQQGMEQPLTYWTPSIAVSAIAFVSGNQFPKWNHDLLVTALKFQEVRRLVIEHDEVKEQEILLKGYGRVRDIQFGPDGALYVLTNTPDALLRVTPQAP